MANMYGISSCKLDDQVCAILQHINFSFSDLNSNDYCVVNVVSALYLITSHNKNTLSTIKGPRLRAVHYQQVFTQLNCTQNVFHFSQETSVIKQEKLCWQRRLLHFEYECSDLPIKCTTWSKTLFCKPQILTQLSLLFQTDAVKCL